MKDIDRKYVGIVSLQLKRYTIKSTNPYRANFRCPQCGDSQKSETKARGWFLERDNKTGFYCHNCGASMGFSYFLKTLFPSLYDDYVVDSKLDSVTPKKEKKSLFNFRKPKFELKGNPLSKLKKISQLEHWHPAKKYVEQRRIPSNQHYRLYYVDEFNKWVNTIIPDKLNTKYDEPRLLIPFIDKEGKMFGFQGRSFKKNTKQRYITIMLDSSKNHTKIFGLDKVDFEKKYYIVEGPIDSLFLDNAVALAGSDGKTDLLKNLDNAVYVFDNEPRNEEIVKKMNGVAMRGFKIAILPEEYEKDINDIVLARNISKGDLMGLLDKHTHSGLEAEFEISRWKKV